MGKQIKRFFHLFEGIYTPGICGLVQAKERLWGLFMQQNSLLVPPVVTGYSKERNLA